ncbi:TonB-dependent receptor [Pseudoduganella namucuonensis]|uniref:TonB dependent receptor n=1 Tax=Pseudoduganella namucuonensis TaxID=1035707 RepID=A0A1I7LRR4_9BURK|nr:TonB-dependent receptor [Pseudoduganella namucuonensis]SFV12371.1 TonB dependent receptor [Pseudoduganella namucuonensis]
MIRLATVIDTFKADFLMQYRHKLNADHMRALSAMTRCRTQASLKMRVQCTGCEHQILSLKRFLKLTVPDSDTAKAPYHSNRVSPTVVVDLDTGYQITSSLTLSAGVKNLFGSGSTTASASGPASTTSPETCAFLAGSIWAPCVAAYNKSATLSRTRLGDFPKFDVTIGDFGNFQEPCMDAQSNGR